MKRGLRDRVRALRVTLTPRRVRPRSPREPRYGTEVVAALEKCWAVLNAPAGKRLAPMLGELVPLLRRHGELDIDDGTAELLVSMSAATIDRRLAGAKSRLAIRGRSHTKPGSLLKSRIPMRTWAEHDENTPGFVEIDLVGHEGGNPRGEFCFTLTVTDIATGWTENRTVRNKAQKHVVAAITDVVQHLPFPIRGIDSDNGSEFINAHLLRYCREHDLKFTRSRSGNKNDGARRQGDAETAADRLPRLVQPRCRATPYPGALRRAPDPGHRQGPARRQTPGRSRPCGPSREATTPRSRTS